MMGSNRRAQVTEAITSAARSAGTLTTAALVLSGVALLIAVVALITVLRRPGLAAHA
jgi:hypothetical protein